MPKLFVLSDCHGFYDEMMNSLDNAGFDTENADHWLITCGDNFDRGRKPADVMRYLRSLPRKVLVKGNHEQLLMDCINRTYPRQYDYHNGTAQTIIDLAPSAETFDEGCYIAKRRVSGLVEGMVPYFETERYIFVHSWIPLTIEDDYPKYYTRDREYHFNPDWRNATDKEWDEAMWGNPFEIAAKGLNKTGKTIVFGHWHCSAGWAMSDGLSEFGDDAKFEPFYGDGYIAIDGCTAHSKKVNVVVLEDNFL